MQALCGHPIPTASEDLPDAVHPTVQEQARACFQRWALLLEALDAVHLGFMKEAYLECQRAGITFPREPTHVDVRLVDTNGPPEWVDAPHCVRCRTEFTFSTRKHHCRRCGRAFCQPCSARELPLPEYGLPEPVRVCEPCYVDRTNGQIRRDPAPVQLPGQRKRNDPPEVVDADLAEAIHMSLLEDQLRQARRDKLQTEEEAMLAAAVAASLHQNPAERTKRPAPLADASISEKDRTTIRLFGELVGDLTQLLRAPGVLSDDVVIDAGLEATARDMRQLQTRLPSSSSTSPTVNAALMKDIDAHLQAFAELKVLKADKKQQEEEVREKRAEGDVGEVEAKRMEQRRELEREEEVKLDRKQEEAASMVRPIQFPPLPPCSSLRSINDEQLLGVKERIQRLQEEEDPMTPNDARAAQLEPS
jgi:hypothetical protein